MTSIELARELQTVDNLIAALSTSRGADKDDVEDLCWLRARRRFLTNLLAVRRDQRGRKVVDLELWRCGRLAASGIPCDGAQM
jgi:hypothetical protein